MRDVFADILYNSRAYTYDKILSNHPFLRKRNALLVWNYKGFPRIDDFIRYSLLTGGALDGFNAQTQDDINKHNEYESLWTGSMTENFNALDLSSFTFSSGLVAGFGLLTGIFNDLWNGMGEYAIVYVFPLTLAIGMLLVGRIARTAASRSSGRSGSGKGGKDA